MGIERVARRVAHLARRGLRCVVVAGVSLVALQGCETAFVTVAPEVSTTATKLGPAEGTASSHMALAAGTAYYFIPIMWDSRVERAYGEALASVPGSTAIGGVTIQENWYWWLLCASRPLTITGEAVKQ